MNQHYPIVDSHACSWVDMKSEIVGASDTSSAPFALADLVAIKGMRKVEVGIQKRGGRLYKRTRGELSQEASVTMYRDGYLRLITALAANAPQRGNQRIISLVSYHVTVQHTPYGDDKIYTRVFKGCRYLGDSDDMKEGNEADKLEITLNPTEIVDVLEGGIEVVLL